MSKQDYDVKLSILEAMNKDQVKEPDMPVSVALQEAEDLKEWCLTDKDALTKAGLNWQLVDDLPVRIGACRYIQSQWQKDYLTKEEAQKEWKLQSPAAYALRDELVHHFLHAFHNYPDLLSKAQKISEGSGHADMIQDLSDLSILGIANPGPLKEINLDMTMLDKAAVLSEEMASLLAKANGQKLGDNNLKITRDKAYMHMKQAVDEIRRHGKYAFWRTPEREKGYVSKYYKQRPSVTKTQPAQTK
jgi:hypothetical protein